MQRLARVVEVRCALLQPVVDTDAPAEVFVVCGIEDFGDRQSVAALQPGALAGVVQALQRERARCLEQTVARLAVAITVALRQRHDQRAVDQPVQCVEHRPEVVGVVDEQRLDQLERRAAGQHTQAPEHPLLALVEQAVAPLERGVQRALAFGRGAVAPMGEQGEAVAHRGEQACHAEQRRARGGQLDRQRQAVERVAQLDHRGGVGAVEREMAVEGAHPLDEERHRSEAQRLHGRQPAIGQRQRVNPQHLLGGEVQRGLAGDEQAQTRRRGVKRMAQRGHVGEQVLGVVQREQHRQRSRRSHQRGRGVARAAVDAQGGGHRAGQRLGIGNASELDPADAVRCRRPDESPTDAASAATCPRRRRPPR